LPDISIVDIDDCERFHSDLLKFNDAMNEWYSFIWSRLVALGDNWRDPQYERLYTILDEELRPGIERYQDIAQDVASTLSQQVDLAKQLAGRA
jgi:hypothetical protein